MARISPTTLVVDTIVFPNDGAHKAVIDMVYIPAKGKIYALMGDLCGCGI